MELSRRGRFGWMALFVWCASWPVEAHADDATAVPARLAALADRLALSDEQVIQLKSVLEQDRQARYDCLATVEWRSCLPVLNYQTEAQIADVLTVGQKALYGQMYRQREQMGPPSMGAPAAGNAMLSGSDES